MRHEKIKSVHITNYYHKQSGGISTAYNRLLEAANRHQRYVRLIVPGETSSIEDVGKYGWIYYVKAIRAPIFDKRYRLMLPFQYVPDGSPIRKILESEAPEMIEIGEKYLLSFLAGMIRMGYFKSLGRPMLVHFSCERMDDNLRAFVSGAKPFRWLARRVMANYIAPMFDFHMANSAYTAQEISDAVSKNNDPYRFEVFFDSCHRFLCSSALSFQQRIKVNSCGADTELFNANRKNTTRRNEILAESDFPDNSVVLLYAGRLSPEKNVMFLPKLLKALLKSDDHNSRLGEFRLLIAGDGPLKPSLEASLKRAVPGKYKMLGHVGDRNRLADIYANSDIFLHPNPREPFGIGPLEAMASGLPVIAPNSGGILSYANSENAWLENVVIDSYFAAVQDILKNPARREMKVRNAIETAREHTWERSTDRLFRLYDEMHEDFCRRYEFYAQEREGSSAGVVGRKFYGKTSNDHSDIN
jgi:glycosyltransferase involved in cell wall biosynthesis